MPAWPRGMSEEGEIFAGVLSTVLVVGATAVFNAYTPV